MPRPPRPPLRFRRRFRHTRLVAFATVLLAVAAFSWGWPGRLVLDGPGVALYLRLAVDHLQHGGVPYWMPEMWTGTPVWALAPSFPTLALVPAAILIGPEEAVKLATLAAQVVGGWGTFVLAQSLWERRSMALPLTAAIIYALHPLFLSHGALYGHETSIWVMAITPWLAWSVRTAFGPGGRRYAVIAGLMAGVAVLQQAEHAYGLALLCGCQLAIELGKARRRGAGAVRHVLAQAGTVVAIGLGAIAFWLAPFLALSKSFVLTPPETVREVLETGIGSVLGHEPGTFLTRSQPLTGTVTFAGDLLRGNVYLSWVCLVPTFLTAFLLSRHDEDGHLTAILMAGAIGVWLSTAGVPLAHSGPAQRFELVPFLVIGTFTGLLLGSWLRRVTTGRAAALWGAGAVGLLLSVPYVTPFLALQRVVPLLASIRFPRFYPVAALGLALGAVYPLRFVGAWARSRRPSLAPALSAAAALVLLGAFVVDVHPYRTFYRARPPEDAAAYRIAAENLHAVGGDFRVATSQFGDPRLVSALVGTGYDVSVGWPHPIAGKQAWRLTGEAMITPPSYREAALGLSGTAYTAIEQLTKVGPDTDVVSGIHLARNPEALPLVRAYGSAVVVADGGVTPELAVSLARRNVAVVRGGPDQARTLGSLAASTFPAADACSDKLAVTGDLAHEVGMACALHRWIGIFAGFEFVNVRNSVGAVFRSPTDGLRAVSVWLDRPPGPTELTLREVGPDGGVGAEIARATSSEVDWDDNAMYAFRFPAIAESAGKRYVFLLSCPSCGEGREPRLVVATSPRGPGNLLRDSKVQRDRAAAFSLVYDDLPAVAVSDAKLRATEAGPGHWRVGVAGTSPSLVVVSEAYFPGWRATVDGKPAAVLETDGAFLGVAVPPGEHTVELVYHEPAAATAGRLVTTGTLVVLLVAAPLSHRRTRRRAAPPVVPSANGHGG